MHILFAATAVFLSVSADAAPDAGALEPEVRDALCAAVQGGAQANVYFVFLGSRARGKIVKAAPGGLTVNTSGYDADISWKDVSPEQLAAAAAEAVNTAPELMKVARFYAALALKEKAEITANRALAADRTLEAEVDAFIASLQPEAPKSDAASMIKVLAPEKRVVERKIPLRVNHEGRPLPPMPPITQPVMFDTPEADAIMSSMQIFPPNSHWNTDISKLPVLPNSEALCRSLARGETGRAATEFTFIIVPPNQPRVQVEFTPYPGECDKEPYPLPDNTPIENWADQFTGTGDRHTAALDPVNMKLYELYHAYRTPTGWKGFGCIWNLASNRTRRKGWTSSDAAGLPILPALIRYDECERGMVEHAMRVCVPITRNECIYPATHATNTGTSPDLPAMGQRYRLKADANISGFSKHARAVALGLQKYGMFVADNGDELAICATADKRLSLRDIRRLKKTDFEAVDTSPLPIPKD
ncbi:MAG TPA: hypothetical protein ENN09_00110 [Planctomycetes bacterium]|nr:hypothetical protein [Planctomycetota bacterium]